jgi:hypothetical protein
MPGALLLVNDNHRAPTSPRPWGGTGRQCRYHSITEVTKMGRKVHREDLRDRCRLGPRNAANDMEDRAGSKSQTKGASTISLRHHNNGRRPVNGTGIFVEVS